MDFQIIAKNFEDALVRYKVACQKDWQFVVRQQSRIVGEKLVKFTPPKTAAIGKRNVARDIGKVFADLSNTKWNDKSLDKMWKAGNFEGVKKALENHPNKSEMPIFKYRRIFTKPVRNIHRAAIGKSGRVPKNWHTSYAVAGKGELKKYIRRVQQQVGIAKSGWLAALTKLGGKAPSFVSRHGVKYGGFIDGNKGDNPFFTLINRVSTFPQGGTPMRILKRAFAAQMKAMENNIKRLMDKSGRIF
ncbi:MAG: hypothetical protein IJI37_00745 [Opitutales bacterium]|nr:hypothetical protein [Opitutales bacterium]